MKLKALLIRSPTHQCFFSMLQQSKDLNHWKIVNMLLSKHLPQYTYPTTADPWIIGPDKFKSESRVALKWSLLYVVFTAPFIFLHVKISNLVISAPRSDRQPPGVEIQLPVSDFDGKYIYFIKPVKSSSSPEK